MSRRVAAAEAPLRAACWRPIMLTRASRPLRDRNLGPEAMYDYDLFAVVCHEGQIDNGHYTCFARSHDEVCPRRPPVLVTEL